MPCPFPCQLTAGHTSWPTTLLGALGFNKAQGRLPLSRCAPPLNPLDPLLSLLLPPTLLGPLDVNKAQGALPLGRRALPFPVSLAIGHAWASHLARSSYCLPPC